MAVIMLWIEITAGRETKKAYDALVLAEGKTATDPYQAILDSYAEGVNDEFVLPVVIKEDDQAVATIGSGDTIVFYNFRADRADN